MKKEAIVIVVFLTLLFIGCKDNSMEVDIGNYGNKINIYPFKQRSVEVIVLNSSEYEEVIEAYSSAKDTILSDKYNRDIYTLMSEKGNYILLNNNNHRNLIKGIIIEGEEILKDIIALKLNVVRFEGKPADVVFYVFDEQEIKDIKNNYKCYYIPEIQSVKLNVFYIIDIDCFLVDHLEEGGRLYSNLNDLILLEEDFYRLPS